ncbi:MAG TPA: hypothetical protein VGG19_17105 [Tepidisphaeraceae bacterium]|jgi:hypothetical protein
MRTIISERLSFGNESACTHITDGTIAVVHACKEPCHRNAVGYSTRTIPNTHPNYLALEHGHHLYLNLIDPPQPLFMIPSFEAFLRFVDREIAERPVLIHCNQGESRAPSLTLLYMAKRLAILPNESYSAAATAFRQTHAYNPRRGIQTWLITNWNKIN